MIRPYISLGLLTLAACATTPTTTYQAGDATSHSVALSLGQRSIDDEIDDGVIDDQFAFGVEYAYEKPDSAVGFEVSLFSAAGDDDLIGLGANAEFETTEIAVGARKSFGGNGAFTPYVGGGLAFLDSELTVTGFGSSSADAIAPYIHGGVNYDVSESVFLGLDLRTVIGAEYEDAGDVSGDYVQFAFVVGFGF